MIENFHFLRPAWLYMIVPLLVLIIYLFKYQIGNSNWESICDKHLWHHILIGKRGRQKYLSKILQSCAGLLAILALAGPTWEKIPQPVFNDQTALVIALDLSPSMDARDITPSRLERARFKIIDILNLRTSGQTALLVYANDAYVVTPLTNDTKTISSQLSVLNTDIMPVPGNNLSVVLTKASALLKQAGLRSGDVLLLTDGVDELGSRQAVESLLKQGYRLSIIGIGTQDGAPVSIPGGGFLKNDDGSIVIAIYEDALLRQLARVGQGVYQSISLDDTDVQGVMQALTMGMVGDALGDGEFHADVWKEQGPWLLLLLLPLAMLVFRRGYLVIVMALLLPLPRYSEAIEWQDLWLTDDQQAARALDQGDNSAAAMQFDDSAWQAVAHYRGGDFAATVDLLDGIDDAQSLYNKGNALGQLGRYEDAIGAYNESLELLADNDNAQNHPQLAEDAQYNLELLKDALEKQQSGEDGEQQSGEDGEQQSGEDGEQQSGEDGEQQSGEDGEQQSGEDGEQQSGEDGEQQSGEDGEQQSGEDGEQQSGEDGEQGEQSTLNTMQVDEELQATEQWLRRIPDDPGGLLKRKFEYQYKQRDARKR